MEDEVKLSYEPRLIVLCIELRAVSCCSLFWVLLHFTGKGVFRCQIVKRLYTGDRL